MKWSEDQSETTDRGGVLLLFGGALGDFLCLLPGLSRLRQQTRGRITVAAQPAFLELVSREEIDTLSVDRREVADLFSTGSLRDSTFDLFRGFATVHSWIGHGDDNYVARLTMASGGKVHVHRLRGMKRGEHASDYLAGCLGVHPTSITLEPPAETVHWAADFWARHGLGDSTLIVHPGSGSPVKNWRGMAAIAERWRARGHGSVLLLCGPAERSADVPHDAVAREPSLHRVAALLRRGARYLGNDSGISHLAGLTGAVGVVTFGPTDPKTWHPLGGGLYVCRAESATCARCARTEFCTHVLHVDDVWEALCVVRKAQLGPTVLLHKPIVPIAGMKDIRRTGED